MRIFSAPRVWSVLLSVCTGVLPGLAGYTFYHAQGASYLSNDPAACVNCHIMREGAIKVSNHHVRSPLFNVAAACQTCHSFPEEEISARRGDPRADACAYGPQRGGRGSVDLRSGAGACCRCTP
ncbi:MAG: hypothetical protein DCC55_27120 [Chloroflexi bacterium]|nr:MAG: hypothetical protein DCC55_27120 [Chloroflexota bacterium]